MFKDLSNLYIENYVKYIKSCCNSYNFENRAAVLVMNKAYKQNALKIEGEYYNGQV